MSHPTDIASSLETMAERREQLRKDLLDTAAKMRKVVAKDLRRFIERETRWRWLQHLDFADAMGDDDIAGLKKKLAELGDSLSSEIESELADEGCWLSPTGTPPADKSKSLEHNAAVWSILQKVAFRLGEVLDSSNFPADPRDTEADTLPTKYRLEYRTPAYFLDGAYCPSLIETYWSQLGELRELGDTIENTKSDSRRKKLEERWGAL